MVVPILVPLTEPPPCQFFSSDRYRIPLLGICISFPVPVRSLQDRWVCKCFRVNCPGPLPTPCPPQLLVPALLPFRVHWRRQSLAEAQHFAHPVPYFDYLTS